MTQKSTLKLLAGAFLAAAFLFTPAWSAEQDSLRQRVYEAATATYIHGMTAEIAEAEFGRRSIPVLLELLADPDFPRRDNVVAVLGYLGQSAQTPKLIEFLENPPASPSLAVEDRALLLAPQSLGQIASRGERGALEHLLEMTAPGSNGGLLGRAASRARRPAVLRDDLLHMALRGLAYSGSPAARGRLDAIAQGRSRPAPTGRDLQDPARRALALFDRLSGGRIDSGVSGGKVTDAAGRRRHTPAAASPGPEVGALDVSHYNVNSTRLDYANHVNVTDPMTDARLDAMLAEASLRMGRADFENDVVCCASFQRAGSGQQFGSAGDGLDIIDDSTEVDQVLNEPTARFKVVRMINYCGSVGTNIIGCAWIGGHGVAVVRYGNVGTEGSLWAHEYGHNVGLSHNTTNGNYIMYGSLGSQNRGLTVNECIRYHSPDVAAQADMVDAGACTDGDVDRVHDIVDNCPFLANTEQQDSDEDGIGDVCDGGCGGGVVDEGEQCDGSDLGGETCHSQGYDGGNLSCNADCTLDASDCSLCGNGVREGNEQCDGEDFGAASCDDEGCGGGSPSCSASCTVDYGPCSDCPVCDNDGVCELGEDCTSCPGDCLGDAGAACGNGICEPASGEDCNSCPSDCRGRDRFGSFCCGADAGCGDRRCTLGPWDCSEESAAGSCCGDLACDGIENGFSCAIDCGAPNFCGDGVCDAGEDSCSCEEDCGLAPLAESFCGDGIDDDCDGQSDCSDADCAEDASCTQTCEPRGVSCESNGDCCSGKCRGWRRLKTCR